MVHVVLAVMTVIGECATPTRSLDMSIIRPDAYLCIITLAMRPIAGLLAIFNIRSKSNGTVALLPAVSPHQPDPMIFPALRLCDDGSRLWMRCPPGSAVSPLYIQLFLAFRSLLKFDTMIEKNAELPTPHGGFDKATFRYFDWKPEYEKVRPYEVLFDIDPKAGVPRCNFSFVPGSEPEEVTSIRGREQDFSLDKHGFAIGSHKTTFEDWFDREALQKRYIPELEQWLLTQLPDAERVVAYDWRVHIFLYLYLFTYDSRSMTNYHHSTAIVRAFSLASST
jgi:hypothetical protein